MREGPEDRIRQQLVQALCRGGQAAEVVVVEGSCLGVVDDLAVDVVQYEIDRIGRPAVRQTLAGEDDRVACAADLDPSLGPVAGLVPDLRRDERARVLVQGVSDDPRVVGGKPEVSGDLLEAAQPEDVGDWASRLVKLAVDDQGIELIGEQTALAVLAVPAHAPAHDRLAIGARLPDRDGHGPLPGQPMDRVACQDGRDPDAIQGGQQLPSSLRTWMHDCNTTNALLLSSSVSLLSNCQGAGRDGVTIIC